MTTEYYKQTLAGRVPLSEEEIAEVLANEAAYESGKVQRAKEAKNSEINDCRLAANEVSFYHAGKNIACDALSKTDLLCTAIYIGLTGSFRPGFPGAWKAIDNTYLLLPDVQAFKDMFGSMIDAGNSNFMHAQQLKQQLASATTIDQINSITW